VPLDPAGYWGLPTSTIDWCEQNYAVTPYLAEFFNSVSSVAMVVAGVLGASRSGTDGRVRVAFGLLVLVGVGSIAFHGTLRRELQMFDELPMLYLVTWLVWLLVETGPRPRFGRWFPASLVGYVLLATAAAAFTRGGVQFFSFHLTFGALELFCLARVTWLAVLPANAPVRRRFLAGIGAYALALGLWFVDLLDCGWVSVTLPRLGVPNPQLHAWWHVLVSVGFFLLLGVVSFDRTRRRRILGVPPDAGG
jgi:dihydroceramidase